MIRLALCYKAHSGMTESFVFNEDERPSKASPDGLNVDEFDGKRNVNQAKHEADIDRREENAGSCCSMLR